MPMPTPENINEEASTIAATEANSQADAEAATTTAETAIAEETGSTAESPLAEEANDAIGITNDPEIISTSNAVTTKEPDVSATETLANDASTLADEAANLSDKAITLAEDLYNTHVQMNETIVQVQGIDPFIHGFTVFVLACFVGYYVVWKVTPALHTPLMSVTNAISSIIIVGALIAVGPGIASYSGTLGLVAVGITAVNIFGGFVVTQRMLQMFKKKGS